MTPTDAPASTFRLTRFELTGSDVLGSSPSRQLRLALSISGFAELDALALADDMRQLLRSHSACLDTYRVDVDGLHSGVTFRATGPVTLDITAVLSAVRAMVAEL